MATWVTHIMIADRVTDRLNWLSRRDFCVGSIAPDCNIENESWTEFTPPREVTHWMHSAKKTMADAESFRDEVVYERAAGAAVGELSFLLGYFAHLIADAEYQRYIRDDDRVAASWAELPKGRVSYTPERHFQERNSIPIPTKP